MKRFLISIVICTASLAVHAQHADSLFNAAKALVSMPDSLLPYLKSEKRQQLVDMAQHNVHADINNDLDGTSALDSLSADYALMSPNSISRWQLAVLDASTNRKIIMLIRHLDIPVTTSLISFYDSQWNPLPTSDFITIPSPQTMVAKPEDMQQEEFSYICSLIQPPFIEAQYDNSSKSILFSLSSPLLQKEDKEKVKLILMQKYVKWSEKKFE